MHKSQINCVVIALGANERGKWGSPKAALRQSIARMQEIKLQILCISRLYITKPCGQGMQKPYVNALILARSRLPPASLLRELKQIERLAGRRVRGRNAPRPLDLDIIAYGGRAYGGRPRLSAHFDRQRAPLVLPHPLMHRRAFVLLPLMDVAPNWVHPIFGVSVRRLLARLCIAPDDVVPRLDSKWPTCEKNV
jgi:2-amino-4-hydroxy-6-hydroxymethyldihydropteridine diphosphokinase